MLIRRTEMDNYKPMLHGGVTGIRLDSGKPVTCIIGNNGCGKSSFLREMVPTPATSTDYTKEGKKVQYITDNDVEYELITDFGSKEKFKFVRDGENLNESFNSHTQASLVRTHFGYTPTIDQIVSGQLKISAMSRVERKKLLYSCYPSDMSFIVDKHKAIVSQIRSIKNNLKLMNEKKMMISNDMMNDDEFNKLDGLSDNLSDFKNEVDKTLYAVNKDLTDLQSHEAYSGKYFNEISPTEMKKANKAIIANAKYYKENFPLIFEDKEASASFWKLSANIEQCESRLKGIIEEGHKVKHALEELEVTDSVDLDQELREVTDSIADIKESLSEIYIQEDLPLIDASAVDRLDPNEIKGHIMTIHGSDKPILSPGELQGISQEISEINFMGNQLSNKATEYVTNLRILAQKLEKHNSGIYNPKCNFVCPLKTNFDNTSEDIQADHDKAKSILVNTQEQIDKLLAKVKVLKDKQTDREVMQSSEYLITLIDRYGWRDILTPDGVIVTLNANPWGIYTKLISMMENSNAVRLKESLTVKLSEVEARRKVIVETLIPAKEMVCKTMMERKVALERLTAEYETVSNTIYLDKLNSKRYEALNVIRTEAKEYSANIADYSKYLKIVDKIKLHSKVIEELRYYRQQSENQQASIVATVNTQKELRIRLNKEVLPTIESLEHQLKECEVLEIALSPNKGLSKEYIIKFTNSLIAVTNEYIARVWNYPMAISPLALEDNLDFALKLKLYNKGSIKDIGMGSTGQQEIIDLAFSLSLCAHLELGHRYPIRIDEPDSGLVSEHRTNLLKLLSDLVDSGSIKQLVMVNHHAALFSAFANSDIVCINSDGIVVPSGVNEHAEIIVA